MQRCRARNSSLASTSRPYLALARGEDFARALTSGSHQAGINEHFYPLGSQYLGGGIRNLGSFLAILS